MFPIFAVLTAVVALQAAPTVSNVAVALAPDGAVQVDYDLSEDAIVTVTFEQGGTLVPTNKTILVAGDVNRVVSAGSRKIVWRADREGGLSSASAAGTLVANVVAWPKTNPPDYMVADLECTNTVLFYASADAIPGGVTNRMYKREKIVMRRIPAGGVEWRMGVNNDTSRAIPHYVKLSADYYIGIYQLTQRQYWFATGDTPSYFKGDNFVQPGEEYWCAPVEQVSWKTMRGNSLWPDNGHTVPATCPLGKLRAWTGLQFDLPTDAQWEFACRGGTGTTTFWGNEDSSEFTKYCWYSGNSNSGTHEVGLKSPNPYGLYDMYGNLYDVCLDYVAAGQKYANHFEGQDPVVDPEGPVASDCENTGSYPHVGRGGNWSDGTGNCRSHIKGATNVGQGTGGRWTGYRLVCPLPW